MAPNGGTGYAEAVSVDVGADRPRGHRARGRREGPGDPEPRGGRRRRLAGRPRGVRRRRHPGHARLPRLQRPGRPGGALVLRARPPDRVGPRHDGGRPDGSRRAADGVRLRGRRQGARLARRPRPVRRGRVRRPDGGPCRAPVDRPRPAGAEPVRAVPAEHGHVARRRRRARSSSAAWTAASS